MVTNALLREPDIGLRMLDVACAGFRIDRRDVLACDFVDLLQHRIYGDAVAAGDIEHLTADTRRFAGQQVRFDDVFYVREIPRLFAVSVDLWPAALKDSRNEESQNAAVLRGSVLPGA